MNTNINIIGKSSKVCRTAEYLDLPSKASKCDMPKSKREILLKNAAHANKVKIVGNYKVFVFQTRDKEGCLIDEVSFAIPLKD